MTFFLLAAASGVVLLVLVGLSNQAAVKRDWDFALSAAGSKVREEMAARLEGEAYLRGCSLRRAAAVEDPARSRALLDVGLRLIEADSSSLASMLRGIGVLSRMAAAVAPVPPLRPAGFRLGPLRSLAAGGAVLHHLLVTTGERLRLRAYVLRRGCSIVARAARRAVAAGAARAARLGAANEDLTAIGHEAIETFHVLLLSLDAEPREGGPVFVIDDWR